MSAEKNYLIPGYETTFIVKTDSSDETVAALKEKVKAVVAAHGGEVVTAEDWGKRRLAYSIENETRGLYCYFVYTGKGEIVKEIERNLRLSEHVLRFLTVALGKEFDVETYKKNYTGTPMKDGRESSSSERGGYDRGGYDRYDRGDRYDRYDRGDRGGYDRNDRY